MTFTLPAHFQSHIILNKVVKQELPMQETIFAQSSKPGKAGVSVFRISGLKSLYALRQLLGDEETVIIPRMMYVKKLINLKNQELIDNAMVVYFQSPSSFTGEDVVEIHTHGSIAIATLLSEVLLNIEGVRLAEAGEFTRRAFLNGKFDLTAAEGLADLIEAETVWQHRQAIRQAGGELELLYNRWRSQLLTIISLIEAYIDFPEENIPPEVLDKVVDTSENLKNSIASHLNDNRRGELLRNGIKLSILGAPNVGKSSLINFLMQRDVSIVSDIAGTTRDVIEAHLDIGGYPIILQDTAGLRQDSKDIIEQEGIKRAIESAKRADIKIIMFDASGFPASHNEFVELVDANTILVINKIELNETLQIKNHLAISIKKNIGLDSLLQKIENIASNIAGLSEIPSITRQRHRHHLQLALQYLREFDINNDLVLASEDIRMAIRSLSFITGKINVEEILGEIFRNFCIGK